MRKKTVRVLIMWLLMLLLLGMSSVWTGNKMMYIAGILWLVIPFVSTMLNLYLRKKIRVIVRMPAAVAKNEKMPGTVTVQNDSRLPLSAICCEVTTKNHLTGEKAVTYLTFGGISSGQTESSYEVRSEHCGYLQVYASKIWLMDWIGFLPVRCKDAEQRSELMSGEQNAEAVLPDTFQPHIYMNLAQTAQEDADSWSQTQRGNDLSEIYAMRDYVPGDSLKQIHWKLSSKRGQLIVREPSLPIEKSLLLFWDKNAREASPEEMDAMAECAASVSQGILNLGYSFTLGWTEGQKVRTEYIEQEEDLLQMVPMMLKHGVEMTTGSGEYLGELTASAGQFGKVIYLAGTLGDEISHLSYADMTCLLCGSAGASEAYHIVSFRPEHYREDLAAIEL